MMSIEDKDFNEMTARIARLEHFMEAIESAAIGGSIFNLPKQKLLADIERMARLALDEAPAQSVANIQADLLEDWAETYEFGYKLSSEAVSMLGVAESLRREAATLRKDGV